MMGEGVIMVLCGLPGSGKSHLAGLLQAKINDGSLKLDMFKDNSEVVNFQCYLIEYDHLLPQSIESQLIDNGQKEISKYESEWKTYRQDVYKAAEMFLAQYLIIDKVTYNHNGITSSRISALSELIKQQNYRYIPIKNSKFIIIIDDNMYLESMRHPYYQLARKYKCGFCQVHVTCDWNWQRNELRENKVGEESMKNMEQKFCSPSLDGKTSREEFNIVISNNNDHYESCWKDLVKLMVTSMENPVLEIQNDPEIKEMSRQICLKNLIHTSDQLLRNIISALMNENKNKLDKAQLAVKGKELNSRRLEVLNMIRQGKIFVPQYIADEIQLGNAATIYSDFKHLLKLQLINS